MSVGDFGAGGGPGPWSRQHVSQHMSRKEQTLPGLQLRQYSLWLNDTGLVEADPDTICMASKFKTAIW